MAAGGNQLGAAIGTLGLDISNFQGNLNIAINLSQQAGTKIAGGLNQGAQAGNNFNRVVGALTGGIQGLAAAAGVGALVGLGRMADEMINDALAAERLRASFQTLSRQVNSSSTEMLAALRTATQGTISDLDLMQQANNAVLLGAARNVQQMQQLFQGALALGRATGRSPLQSISDAVTGVGRGSAKVMDNLGISLSTINDELDKMAQKFGVPVDQLTDMARKQAMLNALVQTSLPLQKTQNDNLSTYEQAMIDAKNATNEFAQEAGKAFSPAATLAVKTYTLAIKDLKIVLENMPGVFQGETPAEKAFLEEITRQRFPGLASRTGIGASVREGVPSLGAGAGAGGLDLTREEAVKAQLPPEIDVEAARKLELDFQKDMLAIDQKADKDRLAENVNFAEEGQKNEKDFQQKLSDENADFAQQRAEQEADFAQQRAESERAYQLSSLREQEDWNQRRTQEQEAFNLQIDQIRRDANQNEAQQRQDAGEQEGRIRRESAEKLTDLQKDFDREQERSARSHRERLLDAAGSLDARAVALEQRRFADEQQDRKQNLDNAKTKESQRLQQQIDDQNAALNKQINRAREAENERIADMQAAFDKQRDLASQERDERLERQKQDHQDAMDLADEHHQQDLDRQDEHHQEQLDREARDHQDELNQFRDQHQKRLDQIADQAREEKDKRQDQFDEQLDALDDAYTHWKEHQAVYYGDVLQLQDNYFKTLMNNLRNTAAEQLGGGTRDGGGGSGGIGGGVVDPNPFWDVTSSKRPLHYPVDWPWPPPTQAEVKPSSIEEPVIPSSVFGRGGGAVMARSISVGDVSIQIAGTTNMNDKQVQAAVRIAMRHVFVEVAQGAGV